MRAALSFVLLVSAARAAPLPGAQVERIRAVVREIYGLDYQKAAALCRRMIEEAPEDPAGYVYLARTYWSEQLNDARLLTIDRFAATDLFADAPKNSIAADPGKEARFRQASEQAIEKAKARLKSQPGDIFALYLLGVAHQNLASFEFALKRRWLDSARAGGAAYNYHRELLRREPDLADARITTGTYTYAAGSLPLKLKWLAFLLGYSGKKERGKQELETAAAQALLAADDARTLLALFYTRDREYEKAFSALSELARRYPRNHLLKLEMAGLRLRTQRPKEAIAIYQDLLASPYEKLEKATVYNWLGVACREAGDLPASAQWIERALTDPSASERTRIVTHLELGRTLDLLKRRTEAVAHYRAVLSAPDFAGSRHAAERLLRRPYEREGR
ncbi:MAG: tetratricopeptide repeat protein [Candidatus Solibacter usitatus]|nr:tetratricopeptide repeat protein [Candidatus Solibacter usitatus]